MADEQVLDPQTLLAKSLFESTDPEVRAAMQDLVAKAHPKARIPERDSRLAAQAELTAIREERAAFKKEMDEARAKSLLETERGKIRESHGLSDEAVTAVEKIMTDEYVGSHTAAAELYKARERAAQEVAAPRSLYSTMDVPGLRGNHGEQFKGVNGGPSILQDRDTWARQMAEQIDRDFATNPAMAAKKWG